MYNIPFRHIHLDFHTSGLIEGLGKDFSKKQFQQALKEGNIDSITICAKCHHGWMYYPSEVFPSHPYMKIDLFGEMLEAAKELGLTVEAYLSVGYDEVIALEKNQWLMRGKKQELDSTPDFFSPGYHQFCLNTPYLQRICAQLEEVLEKYRVDGIFLDIVGERQCYCASCLQDAQSLGIDPSDPDQMRPLWERTYFHYIESIRQTVEQYQGRIEIFHNSGHINRGRLDLMNVNSHLELESLPSGGWGYDHFLLSSRFVQHFEKPFMGMTGRFQFGWGDFGGYKHPNGLRYEVMRFLSQGAGCSIGDQMHPYGILDPGLYRQIGEIYQEVEKKEPWCRNASAIAEIGVLSSESAGSYAVQSANDSLQQGSPDIGAVRILQEGHFLFDIVSTEDDFSKYKVMILPDKIQSGAKVKRKLIEFVNQGGTLLVTGSRGILEDNEIAEKLGVVWKGSNSYKPNYCEPCFSLNSFQCESYVMYQGSEDVEVINPDAVPLAYLQEPFFNREAEHFSSHYHTPSTLVRKSVGMIQAPHGIYAAWNLFSEYAMKGNLAAKYIVQYALGKLLGKPMIETGYPSQVEISLMEQKELSRYILHILHASLVLRGMKMGVVEDVISIPETAISLHLKKKVRSVYLEPQHIRVPFSYEEGRLHMTSPGFVCHQMICLSYADGEK